MARSIRIQSAGLARVLSVLRTLQRKPLRGWLCPQITDFEIMETGWGGDGKFGADDKAVVRVTFKNAGKEPMISFRFQQWKNKPWKIDDIRHPNSDSMLLKELLRSVAEAKRRVGQGAI